MTDTENDFIPTRDDPKLIRAKLLRHPHLANWHGVEPPRGWDNPDDIAVGKAYLEDLRGAVRRKNADLALIVPEMATVLRERGLSEKMAAEMIQKHNKPPFSRARLELEIWKAYEYAEQPPGEFSGVGETPARPIIELDMVQLPRVIDEVCAALSQSNLFRVENRLVTTFHWEEASEDEGELRRDSNAIVVENVDEHLLLQFMTKAADFIKMDAKQNPKVAAPPMNLATHVLAAKSNWKFRPLKGVITAPTLRADGSLLDEAGYDRKSDLYLDLGGVE
jgi:hypothetical protein